MAVGLDECLLRNPLMIAGPGVAEHGVRCPRRDGRPATLAELAETELEHVQFGRSITPLFADPALAHRDHVYSEGGFRVDEAVQNEQADFHPYALKSGLQQERPDLVGRAVCLRTHAWTYVHRLYESDELYDRVADPHRPRTRCAEPARRRGAQVSGRDPRLARRHPAT
ncbi:MAG: hypothetical protein U0W40_17470 [Acidimicrobiia bacterium]